MSRSTPVWAAFDAQAERLDQRFAGSFTRHSFDYLQPVRLQKQVPARLRRPYATAVSYTAWGAADAPLLVCLGGVANTAMRFSFLAADLSADFRVVCMDWLGRGQSGWLADESEYTGATYLEQLRQLLAHLQPRGPVHLLGSSMGGSIAMALAARSPSIVARLVLNDVGPAMPAARRRRRADTLARHYVFRSPEDIHRRVGASQKNDGPVSDEIRHFLAWHQTRWSEENAGRVYRHDPRAMTAYRSQVIAQARHDQWKDWTGVRCPVLLVHGLQSDALLAPTIARMRRALHPRAALAVAHVPETGHTPLLSDRNQTHCIGGWLRGQVLCEELSVPLAYPREAWR
ncbi:alpha/beta fold hydrolase [Paucibacter sp. R3-3]|uniref:Alpha/beta fold hydrolase n=1 Tax=Roseateles agri TaxID=3098619 RepID=A0ABU5DF03_9BURK|nr:alpha/beta fold hydrolase [Paucibacter sp. R3-3]MDY0744848.1 alpha/beta fold hydrolase [Paucibacter sp. R3-3]